MSRLFSSLRGRLPRALTVSTLVLAALYAAPATAQTTDRAVTKLTVRGLSVSGWGEIPSSDPCLQNTLVNLWAGTADDGVRVYYSEWLYNRCTGLGTYQYGSAAPTTYKVSGSLGSAHIAATIALTTEIGAPAGLVEVDNTWTATAPAIRETSTETEHHPGGYLSRYTFKGTSRQAAVVGSAPLTGGTIARANVMSITIAH